MTINLKADAVTERADALRGMALAWLGGDATASDTLAQFAPVRDEPIYDWRLAIADAAMLAAVERVTGKPAPAIAPNYAWCAARVKRHYAWLYA